MDLLVYMAVIVIVGFLRVGTTARVSDDVGIVDTGATVIMASEDLPIGQNLALLKEAGAYTLILEDLGLI